MRDALSLLDQAIAYSGEDIALAQVQAMLGVADPRFISRLITYVATLDGSGGLHLIHELAEAGADLRQVNAQVVEYWRALMLAKAGADVATILDLTEDETGDVMQIARQFGLEELTECARTFAQNDLMQKNQGTPQLGLELAFLACVELHRKSHAPVVAPAPAAQPRPAAVQPRSAAPQAASSTRPATEQERPPPAAQKKPVEEVPAALPDWDDLPPLEEEEYIPEPLPAPGKPAAKDIAPSRADGAVPLAEDEVGDALVPSLTVQQVKDAWDRVKKRTNQRNGLAAATLTQCKVIAIEGTDKEPIVVLHFANEAHYKIVNDRSKDVEWALTTEFGQNCRVRLLPPGQPLPGASSREASQRPARANSTIALQKAARVERPAGPPPEQPERVEQEAQVRQMQEEQVSYGGSTGPAHSSPLATLSEVSENITRTSFQETIEQKARQDPVVQEVVRTFMARIRDVRPK